MFCDLVCLEVHLTVEDDELLLKAALDRTQEVVGTEVCLEHLVVSKVLPSQSLVELANMALLVAVSHVWEQLVVRVEVLVAEFAEAVIRPHVRCQGLSGVKSVLVGKDVLLAYAKVTEETVVVAIGMHLQVSPPSRGDIATLIWTVEAQENECVLESFLCLEADAKLCVRVRQLRRCEAAKISIL